MSTESTYSASASTRGRISDVVEAEIAKRQTAAIYLKALSAEDILEEIKVGRENLYINPPLLALLSERA